MSSSLPGGRQLPASQHDLGTYWGRFQHAFALTDPSTLFSGSRKLEDAKKLLIEYKEGRVPAMTTALWDAKKLVDSTLHPDTGKPVLLPFRMSSYVLSNLVITAGMLQPGLGMPATIAWQVVNQSLNVAINSANANKSSPLSWGTLAQSYAAAVTVSCSMAVGLNKLVPRLRSISPATRGTLTRLVPFAAVASAAGLNVSLMRGEEMRVGIDVFPVASKPEAGGVSEETDGSVQALGCSKKAATIAVSETAASRVLTSTPVMVLPPLILARLQKTKWLAQRPQLTLPCNLGLILVTSYAVLPLALAVFPQLQTIRADQLEAEFHGRGGKDGLLVFNRGI